MLNNAKTNEFPYNTNAEKAVLGSCFLNQEALLNVLASLQDEDFYLKKHRNIFIAIKNVNIKNANVDIVSVTEELMNLKTLDEIGGVTYLQECIASLVVLSSLEYYIKILIDLSVLRKLLNASKKIYDDYFNKQIDDVNSYILSSQDLIAKAVARRRVSSFKTVKDISNLVKEEFASIKAKEGTDEEEIIGVTTGFKRINSLTSGLKRGELIIIAARPSVGKTTFAMNIAYNAATQGKVSVAIFSLEMSSESLFKKMVASISCVNVGNITTGRIFGRDRVSVAAAIEEVSNANIYIDDTSVISVFDIVSKAKKLQTSDPQLGLIVIDYLGLVKYYADGKNSPNESRTEEIRKISAMLKQLARELNIPVIVLSQLNRDVEKRDNKKPMMSDLKDSGSIEQDADIVMLLYRGDYYENSSKKANKLNEPERMDIAKVLEAHQSAKNGDVSVVEVNIAKNRNGQTGKATLLFNKSFARFDSPTKEFEDNYNSISSDLGD